MAPQQQLILTKLRIGRGWTKMELGSRARLHPARVGQIENGRAIPGDNSCELRRLADALGWNGEPRDLLYESDGQ